MNYLMKGFKELNYGDLLAVNGGCSGSCSGTYSSMGMSPKLPNMPIGILSGNTRLTTAIERNLDKSTNKYVFGKNDCDIWTEKVLKDAGFDISSQWGKAEYCSVADHEKVLANKTTDVASVGWSVVLMTDSSKYTTDHCGIIKVENNGTVSFYQNTKSAGGPTCEKYSSVKAFQSAYAYSDFDYLKITN